MAKPPEEDSQEPIEGEVIVGGKTSVPVRAQTRAGRTIQKLLSFVSRFPFQNRRYLRAVKSATEVVNAQTELKEAYIKHQETKGRLEDIDVITGKQRDQRIREWTEEKRHLMDAILQASFWEKDKEILTMKKETELEQEKLKHKYAVEKADLEYRKDVADLKRQVAATEEAVQPRKPRGPSTTDLFKEKDKIDKEYVKRKAAIDRSNASKEKKASDNKLLERWREEMYERVEAQYRREMGDDGPPDT